MRERRHGAERQTNEEKHARPFMLGRIEPLLERQYAPRQPRRTAHAQIKPDPKVRVGVVSVRLSSRLLAETVVCHGADGGGDEPADTDVVQFGAEDHAGFVGAAGHGVPKGGRAETEKGEEGE